MRNCKEAEDELENGHIDTPDKHQRGRPLQNRRVVQDICTNQCPWRSHLQLRKQQGDEQKKVNVDNHRHLSDMRHWTWMVFI